MKHGIFGSALAVLAVLAWFELATSRLGPWGAAALTLAYYGITVTALWLAGPRKLQASRDSIYLGVCTAVFAAAAFLSGSDTSVPLGFALMLLYLGFVPLGVIARAASDKFPTTSVVVRSLMVVVLVIGLAWWLVDAGLYIRDEASAKARVWKPALVVLLFVSVAFGWYLTEPFPPRHDDAKLADPEELKRAGISRDL